MNFRNMDNRPGSLCVLSARFKSGQLWCFIFILFSSCSRPESKSPIPSPYPRPLTIPVNTDAGYVMNPFFPQDSVKPVVNGLGDTVITGRSLFIAGYRITPDKISLPEIRKAGTPTLNQLYQQGTWITDEPSVAVLHEANQDHQNQSISIPGFVLVNSLGDTLTTGQPVSIKSRQEHCLFPAPVPALRMTTRSDAYYNVSILNADESLLNANITSMLEGKDGSIWMATFGGGLCRYDGQSYTNFTRESGLTSNFLTALITDRKGNIWTGTRGNGFNCFDGTSFFSYTVENGLPSDIITCLEEDEEGNIWIGTKGAGLSKLTPGETLHNAEITHITSKEGLTDLNIKTLLADQNGNLWIGTGTSGIIQYELPRSGFAGRMRYYTQEDGLPDNQVMDIYEDKSGKIWFATSTGACFYERIPGRIPAKIVRQSFPFPSLTIQSIIEDRDGHIWFATNGQYAYKLIPKIESGYDHDLLIHFGKKEGLPHVTINCFLEDRFGNLWMGTPGNGMAYIKSRSIRHLGQANGFTDFNVHSVFEDSKGMLWMGTSGDGLYWLTRGVKGYGGITGHYTKEDGLPSNNITCITGDQYGNLFAGTQNAGLFWLHGDQIAIYNQNNGIPDPEIRDLLSDTKGNLWIGTGNLGLYCLKVNESRDQKPFILRFSENEGLIDNNIRALTEDREGRIWICTGFGLSRITLSENGIDGTIVNWSTKEGLPASFVNDIIEDEKGNMWIGTGDGLLCMHEGTDSVRTTFTFYGFRRKILMNTIRSIVEDHKGNIWFGSEAGIHKIIPDSIGKPAYIFLKINKSDGLKSNNFLAGSVEIDQFNTAWWGHQNGGIEVLDLDKFEESREILQPGFSAISINERFIDFRNSHDSIMKGIEYDTILPFTNLAQQLSLPHDLHNLVFHFAAIHWLTPQKIEYSFRMKGLNDAWSRPSTETKAGFRNLPYGIYTFEVRARGETQQWSDSTTYSFRIRPPWWFSWWAYLVYGLLGFTVIYRAYSFQLGYRLQLAEKKRLVELDTFKNRMYSNITHEFRTPLTLIHGPVTQAIQAKTSLDEKDIQSIHRQSGRLHALINQMLELQKLESGKITVHYEYGEIVQILRYLFGSFEAWGKEKNISMVIASPIQEVYMDLDQDKLTKIITNLMSNAIKHTPRNGKIIMEIELARAGEHLMVGITDSGPGISQEDLPYIFERYYQSSKAASGGTGIGLALTKNLVELLGGSIKVASSIGQGSTFTISLPITRQAQYAVPQITGNAIVESYDAVEDLSDNDQELKNSSRPVILVIEDHTEVAQYVARCLAPDFEILISADGSQGLESAYMHIPDLIISDIMMPGRDGFELTAILKSNLLTSHIPVILLTGRGDHDALMTGIREGADAYLTKPFDPAELVLRVKKMLEIRTGLREYYRSHSGDPVPDLPAEASVRENEFLQRIRAFVEDHMNDAQFNMAMLCRHLAMSHPQLHRKITTLTGESAGKFVRSIRLNKAVDLLRHSDFTISEIAYECGFSEPGYFTKIFTKQFGIAPSEYRNQLN